MQPTPGDTMNPMIKTGVRVTCIIFGIICIGSFIFAMVISGQSFANGDAFFSFLWIWFGFLNLISLSKLIDIYISTIKVDI